MQIGCSLELPACRSRSGFGGGSGISHTISISLSYASGSGASDITTPQGPALSVSQGANQSIVIDARGYGLAIATGGLVVDGVAVSPADAQQLYTYTFTNVTAPHTVAVTLEVVDMLHPFEFPIAGTMKTSSAGPVVGVELIGGTRETVFNAPTGTSGVVRNLSWIAAAITDGTTDSCETDLYVEFFYDGSGTAAFSIPLFVLAGMEHHEFALPDLFYSTPAFELTSGPHLGPSPWAIKFGSSGNFRLPIPFTNGLKIDVVSGSPTVRNVIFTNILWQDSLPTCWNRNLRLLATRSNQTLTPGGLITTAQLLTGNVISRATGSWPADIVGKSIILEGLSLNDLLITERTSATLLKASSRDMAHAVLNTPMSATLHSHHQFLSLAGGTAGYVAVIVGGVDCESDADLLFEGNVRLFLGTETEPSLEWSSVEDFAMGSYYFEQMNQSEEGGLTARDPLNKWSIYRVFHKTPIRFTSGIRGTVPQYSQFGPATFNWTTFYYLEV